MPERSEVRFKMLRNAGAAISERTRPLWMLALISTGTLAYFGVVAGASAWAGTAALGYAGDVMGDEVFNSNNKLNRKVKPSVARDLKEAVSMPGRLIGKIRRW